MGASAAYRQVASVGGSAVQHSRKNKWGAAACVSESTRVRRAQAAALHGEHPAKSASGKSPSTKGFPHGPVLRGRQSKDILFSMDHHRAADCNGGVRAGCVPCACRVRAGKVATVRNPATGVPCLIRRSASFVKNGFLSRRGRGRAVGVAVGVGAVGAVLCGEASVKARYLHGVSARHRSWYESGSSSASKGGRAG